MDTPLTKVELVTDRETPLENGETKLDQPYFQCYHEDGTKSRVPLEPANRHYAEVAAWYKAQEKPPFKFNFEA